MTVSDLIRILQTYPPDREIVLESGSGSVAKDIRHDTDGKRVVLFAEYGVWEDLPDPSRYARKK